MSNHFDSAGSMKASGAQEIFDTKNIILDLFLGDGDSRSFSKILESKPYGDYVSEKLE